MTRQSNHNCRLDHNNRGRPVASHLAPCADTCRRDASSLSAHSGTSRAMGVPGVFSGVPAHAGLNGAELSAMFCILDERFPSIFGIRLDGRRTSGLGLHSRDTRGAVPGTSSMLPTVNVRSTPSGTAAWVGFGAPPSVVNKSPSGLLPLSLPSHLPSPPAPPMYSLMPPLPPQAAAVLDTGYEVHRRAQITGGRRKATDDC